MARKPKLLTEEQIREKFSEIPQDGLFDMAEKRSSEPQKKTAKPKAIDHQKCPICGHEKVRIIRVLGDDFRPHLLFDVHFRTTMSGHKFPCQGTGREAS